LELFATSFLVSAAVAPFLPAPFLSAGYSAVFLASSAFFFGAAAGAAADFFLGASFVVALTMRAYLCVVNY